MKKHIAVVVVTLVSLTVGVDALQAFLTDNDGYLDRTTLCRWIGAAQGDRLSSVVAEGEAECLGAIPRRPIYPYGTNCVSRCEPSAIADQIIEGVKETAGAIKQNVRLILGMRA